jgi:UDP-glucuronate 4-epimerase
MLHSEVRNVGYIDDIIEGVVRVIDKIPTPDLDASIPPYKIYNIGNNQPVELLHFIEVLESHLGKKTQKNFLPMQPGDVPITYADVDDLVLKGRRNQLKRRLYKFHSP